MGEALAAKRETKRIEFKQEFSAGKPGAWCELIKDIVAIANSGGGVILVGLDDLGRPNAGDFSDLLDADPADVTNTVAKYTGEEFDGFVIIEARKGGKKLAAIRVTTRTGCAFRPFSYTIPDRFRTPFRGFRTPPWRSPEHPRMR